MDNLVFNQDNIFDNNNVFGVGDFDGNGYEELSIGVPGQDVDNTENAGEIVILDGSEDGFANEVSQTWNQNNNIGLGFSNYSEAGERFGSALGVGDFNGDGYDDLSIGVPGENNGAISVLKGSDFGLRQSFLNFTSSDFGNEDEDPGQDGFGFGRTLAVGDFNGDGYDDLSTASPFASVPFDNIERIFAGEINILHGSESGLTVEGNQTFNQLDLGNLPDERDFFGHALAVGDFDGDNYDDLAVSSIGEGVGIENGETAYNAGVVNIIHGSEAGLTEVGGQRWSRGNEEIEGTVNTNSDQFGEILAVGDFNGDGYDDISIGAPNSAIGEADDAGTVNLLYGSETGLTTEGNHILHQGIEGVVGSVEEFDRFGSALAVGDFNNDGFDDLAVGTLDEDINSSSGERNGIEDAGLVHIFYGSGNGLTTDGSQGFTQNDPNIQGIAAEQDRFGGSLSTFDFNGDGFDDLLIGSNDDNQILFGSGDGLTA